jgi:hypothetical protein
MYTYVYQSPDGSVGIATGYWLNTRGNGVRFAAGARNFSHIHIVHVLGPTQPLLSSWYRGGCSRGGKAVGT